MTSAVEDTASPAAVRVRPWTSDEWLSAVGANIVALVALAVGIWQTQRAASAGGGLGWFNFAVGGLVVSGAANGLWLARGRRAVRTAGAALGTRFSAQLDSLYIGDEPLRSDARTGRRRNDPEAGTFVSAQSMTRYHKVSCALVSGKLVAPAPRDQHERAGRRPCEVCQP